MKKLSKSQTRNHGKFWPKVRPLIWEKAQQLYQEKQAKTMGTDFKGITATHKELREGGYFHTAKLIVLRNLYLQNKNLHSTEEETASALTRNSLRRFKSPLARVRSKRR
jgi:hypothetical protein